MIVDEIGRAVDHLDFIFEHVAYFIVVLLLEVFAELEDFSDFSLENRPRVHKEQLIVQDAD